MAELEHVGIAARDANALLRVFEELFGDQPYKSEVVGADRLRTHFLNGGSAKLELLESLAPSSPLAKFLESRGPGLHHLAFNVDDIDAAIARARKFGYDPIDDAPREGADGKQIFFVHPKKTAGILIEFCQTHRSVLQPLRSSGTVTLRQAGSPVHAKLAFLHDADFAMSSEALARQLEREFYFLDVEAPAGTGTESVGEALGTERLHLVASGSMVPLALRYTAEHSATVASLVLLHPTEKATHTAVETPVLILGRDDHGLEAVLALHASLAQSRLAVLPGEDVSIAARLIAAHAAAGQSAQQNL